MRAGKQYRSQQLARRVHSAQYPSSRDAGHDDRLRRRALATAAALVARWRQNNAIWRWPQRGRLSYATMSWITRPCTSVKR